ncbi:hypothetical protein J2W32_000948 [Variovorax boronicumulans]|uniref:Uncharacterized protein n=1 Tax=Variovorax boronicumulans TaxID=436515 RepID=A0AAW8CUJ7_9BURK|nr:hypothetical protein [Variovorax boronicumulans]MDP9892607.1 hypothetical protein [Variovorax boronicumulans]MDQ0051912.1 hypothetical protein [Variovorax boronicumulans]
MDQRFTYTNTHPDVRARLEEQSARRFGQLNGLVISNAEGAWQFLLAVNGGSAVAVLAFIGAVPTLQRRWWPYVILAVFVLALVLVGIGRALVLHQMQALLSNWNSNVNKFYRDELEWPDVIRLDEAKVKAGESMPWVVGWVSFALFVSGLIALCGCFIVFGVPGTAIAAS